MRQLAWMMLCGALVGISMSLDAQNASPDMILINGKIITAAVNLWNDVLDVKRSQRGIILVQPAVLATIARTLPNAGSCRRLHLFRLAAIRWRACRWRIATNLFART